LGADGLEPLGGLGTREAVAIAPQSVQDIIGLLRVRVADRWDSVCREFDRSARSLSHDLADFSGIRFTWSASILLY
jgi:hypothetical protein